MILRHSAAALLLACCAWPAGAQRAVQGSEYGNFSPYIYVRWDGDLVASDSATDVVRAAPGAFLHITRVEDDGTSRQLEIVGLAGGGMRREFRVNGVPRPYAGEGAAFLRETLPEGADDLLEHSTLVRLRETGGIAAVLAHVAGKRFAATRARDYVELLADPSLSPQDYARVLQAARATEDSAARAPGLPGSITISGTGTPSRDPSRLFEAMRAGEDHGGARWPRVLRSAAAYAAGLPPRSQAALVAAIMQLPPDAISLDLLRDVAHAATLDDPSVADAFYGVMRGAPAGSPAGTLPILMVQDPSVLPTVTAGAIRAGRVLGEAERVRLLLAVPAVCLRSPTVRAAYSEATQGVTYDMDRLRVQTHLQQATATAWQGLPPPCGRG